MQLLPKWVMLNTYPAIYDFESMTATEQTARVYGAMQTLIGEYNKFADSVNTALGTFTEEEQEARKEFETKITKVYREFSCQMDKYLRLNLDETATKVIIDGMNNGSIPVPTDSTLTRANYPAEAAATGAQIAEKAETLAQEIAVERARINNLAKLTAGSTTADAELIDIRTDYKGKVHETAGQAVREQAKERMLKCETSGDVLRLNNAPMSSAGGQSEVFGIEHTGFYFINTGIKIPTSGFTVGSISLEMSTVAVAGYTGTENTVENINVGIYIGNNAVNKTAASVCGEFTGDVGVGLYDSVIYIILGNAKYKWFINTMRITSAQLRTTGGVFEYNGQPVVERATDTERFSSFKIMDKISFADVRGLLSRVSDLEENGTPTNNPVIVEHRARRFSTRQKMGRYSEYIKKYLPMTNLIRFGDTQQKADGEALKQDFKPFKLLFVGDSHTQLQYAYGDPRTDNTEGMQGRPCGFSNPEHWAFKMWQTLNPNALKYDGTVADNSAYGNIMEGNGRTVFLKVEDDTPGVTISGDYEYNRYVDGAWILSSCGGQPSKGERQFAFFHGKNSYVEFTIPKNNIGFAVTMEMFTGTMSNGTIADYAADRVQISVNGSVLETINMRADKQNYKYIGKCPDDARSTTVRITNLNGGWMPIWGLEYYGDIPVIPINAGISGGNIADLKENFQKAVAAQNPDMVIFEPSICNDLPAMYVYKEYSEYFASLDSLTNGNVIVVLPPIPNTTVDSANAYTQYQEKRNMIFNMANTYGYPVIDLASYLQSIYGQRLGAIMPDNVHLGAEGNTALHALVLNSLFFGEY